MHDAGSNSQDSLKETQGEKPEVNAYEMKHWGGTIYIAVCSFCGKQADSEDDMILHVLNHYPGKDRDKILDKLVKEKENGR